MKKKTWMAGAGVVLVVLAMALPGAYANHGRFGFDRCKADRADGGLQGIFFAKSHAILEHGKELGLAEDKVVAIKNLKLETKKMLLKQDAEIQATSLDIMAKLHENPVNVDALDKLVDQKYDLQKAQDKSVVEAVAKLKGMLTKEQCDQLSKLWQSRDKGAHGRCKS